jgi:galactose-1-phosphate uridylyltransferase
VETIDLIKELKQNILNIQSTDSLDDLKEAEFYEFQIMNTIFHYCLKNKYSTEGFPEKYQDLLESEDEDFQDFLDFSVKSYYVYKVSIHQNDVFKMMKHYFSGLEIDYNDQDCMDDILLALKILEQEGVTLIFERELFENVPLFRPKLPG